MITFTNRRFFLLQIIAHVSLLYVLISPPFLYFALSFSVSIFLLFISTTIYHRLLSHRSWDCPHSYEIIGVILGIFSFTGTPVTRTLAHRYHHAYSDTVNDPHSPKVNGVWLSYFPMLRNINLNPTAVRDVLSNSLYMFIHTYYLTIILVAVGVVSLVFGFNFAIALLVAPGAICWMNISLCNIVCHWGTTGAKLSQSQVLALITFGEGFHQHHHDTPLDPDFSAGKGVDPGYQLIKMLRK